MSEQAKASIGPGPYLAEYEQRRQHADLAIRAAIRVAFEIIADRPELLRSVWDGSHLAAAKRALRDFDAGRKQWRPKR